MHVTKISLIIPLFISFYCNASTNDIVPNLNKYGTNISEASEKGSIRFLKSFQTTSSPMNAYRIDFETSAKELISVPDAEKNQSAKMKNLAITKAWETRFCSSDLISLMKENNIDMISGFLMNKGEPQHIAVCFKNIEQNAIPSQSGSEQVKTLGVWYDDVGSPNYLDSTLTIFSNTKGIYLKRLNGDGSTGTYPLEKQGNKYKKIGDKHGAYYIIKGNSLEIYDRVGFIRTANNK
ncbi:hypothetical protein [Dickeya fangzhongdai]|uniref:hypothetical protein n=1 Tax=Dickeya fangzhongdai TaxID=1778540 RepID=UPI000B019DE9|nr:hypothetical protein [Dickeya fangzhongdai]